ncbi:MAG: general secretion pathway protein GspK, partial [Sphingomonas sp.]
SSTTDWIDTDQDQQAMGAEDGAYLGRDPSYRTAGTLMSDVSELRAVAGMTPDIYATVRPWLCTLPVARPAPINVNTLLPEQAPLFAMLLPDTLSVEAARQLILKRPPQGYGDTTEFFKGAALQGATNAGAEGQTAVVSKWFALDIDVTLGTTQLQERALIDATRLPARLVSRQWGEPS